MSFVQKLDENKRKILKNYTFYKNNCLNTCTYRRKCRTLHRNQEQNLIKNLEPAATDKRHKIMKKQVKDQLEKMVKAFNKENEKYGPKHFYEVESRKFDRGKYSFSIRFRELFYSTDFRELMDVITANNLCLIQMHRDEYTELYLQ